MIREAYPEDYSRLLNIQTICIHDLVDIYSEHEIQAWITYLNKEGPGRYGQYENRVFEDKNEYIAGFISWLWQGSQASIECLYVLPKFRNRGIGKILLKEAEANLKLGTTVSVRSTLNAAPFYERYGYVRMNSAISRAGFSISVLEKTLVSQG